MSKKNPLEVRLEAATIYRRKFAAPRKMKCVTCSHCINTGDVLDVIDDWKTKRNNKWVICPRCRRADTLTAVCCHDGCWKRWGCWAGGEEPYCNEHNPSA